MTEPTPAEPNGPSAMRLPTLILAAMVALVAVVSGNLSGVGIGDMTLLYDSIALPRLAIAVPLVLAAWTAWLLLADKDERLRADPVWALLGVLAVWAMLSTAMSPHRILALLGQSERLEGAVTVVLYAALYGIALQTLRSERDIRVVAACLGGAAAGLSVYGLAQYAGFDPFNYSFESYGFDVHRAFATFGNPNFFAGLLVLALPVLAALALSARRRVARAVWAAAAVLALCALFVTFTRGAWLAAGVEVLLVAGMWARARRGPVSRGTLAGIAAAASLLALLVVLSLSAPPEINVASRIAEAFQGTGSASERTLLVGIAGAAAVARPLLGYGPDAFLPALRLHRTDAYARAFQPDGILNNAHSWPLQYAATLGFVGAALLVAAIAVALWRSRRSLTAPGTARGTSAGEVMLAGVWIGCTGFAVHMLLSVSVLGATVPFWVLLGALGASGASKRVARPVTHPIARRVAGVVTALACIVAVGASFAFITADASYLQARLAFGAGDYRTSLELAYRARAYNPVSLKYARGTAEASGELVAEAIRQGADFSAVRELYAIALGDYERVLRLDPNDYPGRAWLASLQARAGLYLSDDELLSDAAANASVAATLDRHHVEVTALMRSPDKQSADAAASVRRLP